MTATDRAEEQGGAGGRTGASSRTPMCEVMRRHMKEDARMAAGECARGRGGKCELGIKGL